MSEHPIEGLMNTALQNIRQMMDVNTIIGEKITTEDGTVIIPVSKVSLGFASGGSDFPSKTDKELFGGGSGAGGTIIPVAFIVISNGDVKLLQISPSNTPADKAISLVPELFDKITALFNKNKNKGAKPEPERKPEN
ncbi:MAG: GerW family sporulation protein [Clostridia bacterium]|nr:GerW family sporulation protein [Clostridia bacterium]